MVRCAVRQNSKRGIRKVNVNSIDVNLCRCKPAKFFVGGRLEILYSTNGSSLIGELSGFGIAPQGAVSFSPRCVTRDLPC